MGSTFLQSNHHNNQYRNNSKLPSPMSVYIWLSSNLYPTEWKHLKTNLSLYNKIVMVLLEIMNVQTLIAQVGLILLVGRSVNDSPSAVSCHNLHEKCFFTGVFLNLYFAVFEDLMIWLDLEYVKQSPQFNHKKPFI